MRIVRFQQGQRTTYGVWEGDLVHEIVGSIFGEFARGQVTHRVANVRLLAPVEPTRFSASG